MSTEGFSNEYVYPKRYFQQCAPIHLKLVAALNGHQSTPLTNPFTYLELGCGNAISLCIHAAANPLGHFYGIDHRTEYIQFSQKFAKLAGISNVTFIHSSFSNLLLEAIPDCDFIVLQGVYSQVKESVREDIRKIVHKKLTERGIFYVNYHAKPGWTNLEQLQELIGRGVNLNNLDSDQLSTNIQMIDDLIWNQAEYFTVNQHSVKIFDELKEHSKEQLMRQFAHGKTKAFYLYDVVEDFHRIDLAYLGSAVTANCYEQLVVPTRFYGVLQKYNNRLYKDHMIDFIVNTAFREDLFVRSAAMSTQTPNNIKLFEGLYFTATNDQDMIKNGVKLQYRTYKFEGKIAMTILDLLSDESMALHPLLLHPNLIKHDLSEVYNIFRLMVALKVVTPCLSQLRVIKDYKAEAENNMIIAKTNAVLFDLYSKENSPKPFVSSVAGSGLWVPNLVAIFAYALIVNQSDIDRASKWIITRMPKDQVKGAVERQERVKQMLTEVQENNLPYLAKYGVYISAR